MSAIRRSPRLVTRSAALLVWWQIAAATTALAASPAIPFVRLTEERGHLAMASCLPPGRTDFSATDEFGYRLKGFVLVNDLAGEKRVRIFQLKGDRSPSAEPGVAPIADGLPERFSMILRATAVPDHYELRASITRLEDSRLVFHEARLERNCCGYNISVSRDGAVLSIGRAPRFSSLMLQAEEGYQVFEELATLCCRPGFEFVPASRFSPKIVHEVVAADESRPGADESQQFRELVEKLDSDEFATRQAATTTLIDGGRRTLWLLESISDDGLSPEQRHRLKLVRSALREFSDPPLPFEFSPHTIREIIDHPAVEWLTEVAAGSNLEASVWAREKLVSLQLEAADSLPADTPEMMP